MMSFHTRVREELAEDSVCQEARDRYRMTVTGESTETVAIWSAVGAVVATIAQVDFTDLVHDSMEAFCFRKGEMGENAAACAALRVTDLVAHVTERCFRSWPSAHAPCYQAVELAASEAHLIHDRIASWHWPPEENTVAISSAVTGALCAFLGINLHDVANDALMAKQAMSGTRYNWHAFVAVVLWYLAKAESDKAERQAQEDAR